jgi:SSS family solute:Na+ symporter
MMPAMNAAMIEMPHAHFTVTDWIVVAWYLLLTTLIGARLAGRQATIRDFFLGGRKLPWWAVCGSILATEVSAVTFISVPALSFAAGGDFTYLQLALGSILARVVIGFWFVPAYYQREIYSPYQFIGQRLGAGVEPAVTGLFMLGALLAQGVRVYLTALVLQIVTGVDLVWSIWLIGAFAVTWTLLGGITTVIWTDVIQFIVLFVGACLALAWAIGSTPGGGEAVLDIASEAGKFRMWNLSLDPSQAYTLWAGLFGVTFLNLAAFGTDQVMAQRMLCCRGPREARRAIIVSSAGVLVAALMLLVGVGLFAYFAYYPIGEAGEWLVEDRPDRIFPIFIVQVLPAGISGLVVAAIFAAAISTLDSTLAALAQTTVTTLYLPWQRRRGRPTEETAGVLAASKLLVIVWGAALCGVATGLITVRAYRHLIDLALAITAFTYGGLLGALLLALLPFRRDGRGLLWGIPASVLAVLALQVRGPAGIVIVVAGSAILLVTAWRAAWPSARAVAVSSGVLAAIPTLCLWAEPTFSGWRLDLAYPWYFPIGTLTALLLGWALGRPTANPPPAASSINER